MRKLCFLFIIVFASFTASYGFGASHYIPEPGKLAPGFFLKDVNGSNVSFSEFKGKVVLINFWATWCAPCRDEMTSLNNLYKSLKDKGFVVLAISIDSSEQPVKSFIAEKGLSFPVLLDKDKSVYNSYAVIGQPMSFLIDRNGIVLGRVIGGVQWDSAEMKNKISAVLKKK
jgi:peroxiredoxin